MTDYIEDFTAEQIAANVSEAHGILAALDQYEETHCKGAPCFRDALESMKAVLGE